MSDSSSVLISELSVIVGSLPRPEESGATSPPAAIFLIHAAGPDRDALATYLARAGHPVSVLSRLSELEESLLIQLERKNPCAIVASEALLADSTKAPEAMNSTPVVILGASRRPTWTSPTTVRLANPFYLKDVADQIAQLTAPLQADKRGEIALDAPGGLLGPSTPVPEASSETPISPQSSAGPLLRGVSHALSNPLAAISGWLQLVTARTTNDDPRHRALTQMGTEILQMEKLIQALGLIGGRPSAVMAPFELRSVLKKEVERLLERGLPIVFTGGEVRSQIVGDPAAFTLLFDLLLSSFAEERQRVQQLHLSLSRNDTALILNLWDQGGSLMPVTALDDLGEMLRTLRHTRALALALAQSLIVVGLGGKLSCENEQQDEQGVTLSMTIPTEREAPH